MTASRADLYRLSAIALVALIAAGPVSNHSLAQIVSQPPAQPGDSAPATEPPAATVPTESAPVQAPIRLGPRRLIQSSPQPQDTPSTAPNRPDSIDIQALESVDADSVGTLDDQNGGLGTAMWDGTERALAIRLLALLPREIASPAMRSLTRRLLLTRAMAPKRTTPGPGLLSLRARALFAMGDHAGALDLIKTAPSTGPDEQLLFTEVESRFHRQDTQGACSLVQGGARDLKGAYWQQALAFCLALAGKNAEAILVSDILAERSRSVDPAFFVSMDTLAGALPPTLKSLKEPSGLLLTMLKTAGIKLPESEIVSPDPAVNALIAQSPNAPLPVRLAAGERAALYGALTSRQLTEVYRAEKFEKSMIGNAIALAEPEWGPRGRALLVQAAVGQAVPAARAEALQRAIQLARLDNDIPLTAHALALHIRNIRPAPELLWFAGDAVRSLIAAGAWQEAQNWLRMVDRQARRPEDPDLSHFAALAGVLPLTASIEERLVAWWGKQSQTGDEASARGRLLFSLLASLGVPVPGGLWAAVIDDASGASGQLPPGGIRALLPNAASAKRVGETVALSLLTLGKKGPSADNMAAVEKAVSALHAVGLTDDARRIALEAAVASGL